MELELARKQHLNRVRLPLMNPSPDDHARLIQWSDH